MHGGIGVERLDQRQQRRFGRVDGQSVLDRVEAASLGLPALACDIGPARWVFADQDDRETRRHALRDKRPRVLSHPSEHFVGDRRAVEHEGGCFGHGPSHARFKRTSLRPEDEARLMARARSGLQHAHARLVEQIAGETVGIAVAGPGLEAEERRAGTRP